MISISKAGMEKPDETATHTDQWLRYLYFTGRYNEKSDGASDSSGPHCGLIAVCLGGDLVGQ